MADSAQNDQEQAVNISAFVSPEVTGFTCTVKQRYTDFLVNEISPEGQVLHLKDVTTGSQRKDATLQKKDTTKEMSNGDDAANAGAMAEENGSLKRQAEDEPEGATSVKKPRTENGDVDTINMEQPNGEYTATPSKDTEVFQPTSNGLRKEAIIASFPDPDRTSLESIFGPETTSEILSLHANVTLHPDRKPRDQPWVKSSPITEKAKRTEAHVMIRKIFASKLETATMQDLQGVISIKAAPPKGPSGARGRQNGEEGANGAYTKGKVGWSELGGEYLHFTLYKENKDTMEVLYFIASNLKVPVKNFQFAGTKDRRGVTVQRVAIFRVRAEQLARANKMARGWRVGDFKYEKHGLELGELDGNEFLLTLRDCRFSEDEGLNFEQRMSFAKEAVEKTAKSFQKKGFLNYYGLQRFGTFTTGTHVIGQKMLKGDLEGAVDAILTYSDDMLPENQEDPATSSKKVPQDDISRADAIRHFRQSGRAPAPSDMPRRFQAESALMQYLSKRDRKTGKLMQERDWQGALMQIQRNLRLMYVHAYQSFIWNAIATHRWETYGDKVVEGDLVIVGEKDGPTGPAKDSVDEDGEPVFHPAEDDSAPSAGEDAFTRARALSREEAESGKFDIFDVVLPLPGFDVEYPANEIGKFYEEFMASETGGGLDPHNMRRSWKDISLSGSYRKVMARPGPNFGFEIKSYAGEEQLVDTDLERVEKRQFEENGTVKGGAGGEETEDRKIAVVLKMQLGSSQYATMALREMCKGGARGYKPEYSTR